MTNQRAKAGWIVVGGFVWAVVCNAREIADWISGKAIGDFSDGFTAFVKWWDGQPVLASDAFVIGSRYASAFAIVAGGGYLIWDLLSRRLARRKIATESSKQETLSQLRKERVDFHKPAPIPEFSPQPLTFRHDESIHRGEFKDGHVLCSVAVKNVAGRRMDNICIKLKSVEAFGSGKKKRQRKANMAVGIQLATVPQNEFKRGVQPPSTFSLVDGDERVIGVVAHSKESADYPICLQAARLEFPDDRPWKWAHAAVISPGGYELTFTAADDTSVCGEFVARMNVTKSGNFSFKLVESPQPADAPSPQASNEKVSHESPAVASTQPVDRIEIDNSPDLSDRRIRRVRMVNRSVKPIKMGMQLTASDPPLRTPLPLTLQLTNRPGEDLVLVPAGQPQLVDVFKDSTDNVINIMCARHAEKWQPSEQNQEYVWTLLAFSESGATNEKQFRVVRTSDGMLTLEALN